ncbi:P-loop containing nucleoside triphosphate hydrolase protein [Aspergillus egyptiacus]|nr:P-loop containing nucleoside triphosphate hydrolase protein [Aspergillus egyptiacus]
MTSTAEISVVGSGVLGLLVTLAWSVSALWKIWARFSRDGGAIRLEDLPALERYEDEDGEATEQSVHEFERAESWQKWAIAGSSVAGWGVSLALAVVVTCSTSGGHGHLVAASWLQMVGWIVLCVQPVAIFVEPSCVERYYLGLQGFWTSVMSVLVLCIQGMVLWSNGYRTPSSPATTVLLAMQVSIACVRGLACILIPRRPNVFFESQVVDQELSVSVYNRFTYGWATDLLRFASRNKRLGIDDLPKLPFAARAEPVHVRLERYQGSRKLWVALVLRHARALTVQGLLSLVVCVLGFGPQVALYKILKVLEDRAMLTAASAEAWLYVGGLGILLALSSSIESWLWWLIYSDLWVPIYEGLSGLVFAKSMRCKDVKSSKASAAPTDEWDEDEEVEEQEKSRQSIINLAAVDSKRIADFVTFSYLIPSCVIRLAIAAVFLARLIGWPSLLAGIGGAILLTPFNSWLTKRYATAQEELMKASDKRTGAVTEVLQGIRQIKFGALEQPWQDRIKEKRHVELNLLWKTSLYTTGMVSVWIMGPLLLSAVSLTVHALTRGELSPSVAFTALSIFGSIESSLAGLPDLFSKAMEAKVSADRIDRYLSSEEKISNAADVDRISFQDTTVAWPAEDSDEDESKHWDGDRFVLRHLCLTFPPKGLSVIVGKTGSGKSLLLASILGECDTLAGSVAVPRAPSPSQRFDHLASRANWIIDTAVAYVAQNPWMENASIRENILFGLPYDKQRYRKTLFASGLEKDMKMLPDGDLTDIGANGINLSGGQRWRVSFARALYSRAGILVMDDIFSALDAETGRHVYEHALTGELGQGRTRILATHHVGLCLPRTDYCVLLENGFASHAGTVEELNATGGLTDLLGKVEVSREQTESPAHELPKRKRSSASGGRRSSAFSMHTIKKFVPDEKRETGSISFRVYAAYLHKGNRIWWWILAFLAHAAFMALLVGRSWWVSVWTAADSSHANVHSVTTWQHAINHINTVTVNRDLMFYLSVYVGISAAACLVGTVRCLVLAIAFIESSRQLFDDLLATVLRAPLRWLDTVPLGRILNRFTSDIYLLDWRLGYDMGNVVYKALELLGILVAGVTVSPVLLVLACALLMLCVRLCRNYLAGIREIKRLESTAKSPVLEKFGTSLAGLATIRAFNKAESYINDMYNLINRHAQTTWYMWLFNRWLGFWMALIGALFSTMTAALVVYMPGVSAALAGFAISFALQYNYAVAMGLRFYANVEIDMNATERILEYSNIETEPQGGYPPPASWPTRGRIEVEDLEVAYAPDLPPVLKGLTFTVENNQRVGVVGRTGAGKSSLTLALFRFLEARRGRILIDGLDISCLSLQSLRSRLAIIPQDPVLFSGTVRSNLDPFNEHTDLELYNALERVHLLSFSDTSTLASSADPTSPSTNLKPDHDPLSQSATLPCSSSSSSSTTPHKPPPLTPTPNQNPTGNPITLTTPISTGGTNLSQGQRQLLCLARAIITRPRIMILDEATSAVDMETDALIQQSIRSEFGRRGSDSSLLVVAHRLSTIADFDRILVLDDGRAVEFGRPADLLEIEGGVFKNLVERSGERAVVEGMIRGGNAS